MEVLLRAIEEKLAHVTEERNRWIQYKDEHTQAEENLREFQKSFRKDILVPIGSKALMPGTLYHTNEIFVGMYRGLFVKCSADKAIAVCKHRLNEAHKRLEALNVEYKMYKDRLDVSGDDQIFGAGDEQTQEIIEEYDEDQEREWRVKHQIRMREHKKREAEERQRQLQTDDDKDYMAILDEAELMEELENELEQMNVKDDEELREYLRTGEINFRTDANDVESATKNDSLKEQEDLGIEIGSKEFEALSKQVVDLNDAQKLKFYEDRLKEIGTYFGQKHNLTNIDELADKRVTEECLQDAIAELSETISRDPNASKNANTCAVENINESTSSSAAKLKLNTNSKDKKKPTTREDYERIEKEFEEQEKSKSELLVYYKSQLRSVVKSLSSSKIDQFNSVVDAKMEMYEFICERIDELRIDIHQEKQIKAEEDFVDDGDIEKVSRTDIELELDATMDDGEEDASLTGRRKISFASEPIVTTFNEDDEPWRVQMENNTENLNSLMDATFQFFNSPSSSSASSICGDDEDANVIAMNDSAIKNADVCEKLQTEYASQNSNENDVLSTNQLNNETIKSNNQNCDDSTIGESPNPKPPSTLILQFKHSTNKCTTILNDTNDDNTIRSPLDIYKKFGGSVTPPTESMPSIASTPNEAADLEKSKTDAIKEYVQKIANINTEEVCRQMKEYYEKRDAMKTKLSNEKLNESTTSTDIPNINAKPAKSILKNRNAVELEMRQTESDDDDDEENDNDGNEAVEQFYTQDDPDPEPDSFPTFSQVVGDIVERNNEEIEVQSTKNPEPSSNEPKAPKRASLFKMSRRS